MLVILATMMGTDLTVFSTFSLLFTSSSTSSSSSKLLDVRHGFV